MTIKAIAKVLQTLLFRLAIPVAEEENVRVRWRACNKNSPRHPDQSPVPTSAIRPQRGPLIVGKLLNCTSNVAVAAAHLWYKKSVFHVDNVSCSVTNDEMTEFINSLLVRLASCTEVKPRRRRNEVEPPIYKAFRVRINSDDRHQFLDANKWPTYMAISHWLFQSNNSSMADTTALVKKQRIGSLPDVPVTESATANCSRQRNLCYNCLLATQQTQWTWTPP